MAGSRLRAFRTYGTNSNLRASLREFASSGGGLCTSLIPAAQGRLHALSQDIEGLHASAIERVIARFLTLGGEAMMPVADGLQEREALTRACRHLPESSPFFACREYSGFVRRLSGTMRELRHWHLDAASLQSLSSR